MGLDTGLHFFCTSLKFVFWVRYSYFRAPQIPPPIPTSGKFVRENRLSSGEGVKANNIVGGKKGAPLR